MKKRVCRGHKMSGYDLFCGRVAHKPFSGGKVVTFNGVAIRAGYDERVTGGCDS
tara:strand:+ start:325 stop:486 length:162 start_codon:yes stop_codon:yes gene_type:complete